MFFVFLQAKAYDYKRIFNIFKPKQQHQQQQNQKSCTHSCILSSDRVEGERKGGGGEDEEKEQNAKSLCHFLRYDKHFVCFISLLLFYITNEKRRKQQRQQTQYIYAYRAAFVNNI